MSRFFVGSEIKIDSIVTLGGEDAHHLVNVLRRSSGEFIELCDQSGYCYRAEITAISRPDVTCRLLEQLPDNEPAVHVSLAFGLLKGDKTELVLQKATELGVAGLLPFYSERSVTRLTAKKSEGRLPRWQKIVRSAAGQCRRNRIPVVSSPCEWKSLLSLFPDFDRVIFCWEDESRQPLGNLLQGIKTGDKILLVTGAEGGFSEAEAEEATALGAQAVTLGPRILRAETAAITAAALVLYDAGELGGRA